MKLFNDDEKTPFAFALLIFVILLAIALGANEDLENNKDNPNYYFEKLGIENAENNP